jgi:hypothetical protein
MHEACQQEATIDMQRVTLILLPTETKIVRTETHGELHQDCTLRDSPNFGAAGSFCTKFAQCAPKCGMNVQAEFLPEFMPPTIETDPKDLTPNEH